MPAALRLEGQVFGDLTVIERAGTHRLGFVLWSCRCSCGAITTATSGELRSGHKRSCGCMRDEYRALPGPEWVFRELFRKYRESARERGFDFQLTTEEFRSIIANPCYYCGAEPTQVKRLRKQGKRGTPSYSANGVDRFDNTQGYSLSNCVPCCVHCNRAKLQMSAAEFIALCHRVAARHEPPQS